MRDILPEQVIAAVRDHYYARVGEAEVGYRYNAADEDSVTGALGQALLTPERRFIAIGKDIYFWSVQHYKFGGRGKGAAESSLGADGIFEIQVILKDEVYRRKGLLFQAKKEWHGKDSRLVGQAKKMIEYSPSAIVVDYGASGYSAVAATDVVEAGGDRRKIPNRHDIRLSESLGDEFLLCRRGEVGMFWDPTTQSLEFDGATLRRPRLQHVIKTDVALLR